MGRKCCDLYDIFMTFMYVSFMIYVTLVLFNMSIIINPWYVGRPLTQPLLFVSSCFSSNNCSHRVSRLKVEGSNPSSI